MSHRRQIRSFVLAGLLALVCASPAALSAQNDADDAKAKAAAEAAAAVARADSIRATLVQPPGQKSSPAAAAARAPFRLLGATIGIVGGAGYAVYGLLDHLGLVGAAKAVNRDLEAIGIKVRPGFIGNRSGPALGARWEGGPLFLEGAYSIRGYQLVRGGLAFGDTLSGLELAGGHHKLAQVHFWGIGPDAALEDESDYAWTRRDVTGSGWVGLVPHVRVGAEGGWEEDTGGRGNDAVAPDVVDRFAQSLPFGALSTDRFAHVGGSADLDFTWIGPTYEQVRGARLLGSWTGYRGLGATDSDFQIGAGDLRVYVPISRQHAFAFRVLAREVFGERGDGVPLYYLPRLGSTEGLRGQKGWRYRDRAVAAGSAEWRYQVWWHPGDPHYRLDAFVFADRGAVGTSLGNIDDEDFKTTPGLGLRFMDHGVGKVEVFLAFRGDKPRTGLRLGATF